MFTWLSKTIEILSRSGKWKTVRRHHLEKEPYCQACRKDFDLEVHHILPVHAGGDELAADNLITLCRNCHFAVGHACDWHAWRPDVVFLAAALRQAPVSKVAQNVNPARNSA